MAIIIIMALLYVMVLAIFYSSFLAILFLFIININSSIV